MPRIPFGAKLGAILVLALALRLAGTDWGKPYAYHFDEPFVLKPALRIVANGDLNPHFFRYPSLLIYLESAVVALNNVLADMPLREPEGPGYGPQDLYPETWPALLGGRYLVALLGTLGVLAVSLVAGATGGTSASLMAALTLALFPLHVEHSHYLTTDVPAATLATLALAALLHATSWRGFALAGTAAGLSISFKYTGAAVLPLLALLACSKASAWKQRLGHSVVVCAAAAAVFAATTPFAWLDLQTFLKDVGIVRSHYTGGHLGAEGSANWGWYLSRLRQDGLGDLGLAFVACGAALLCIDVLGRGPYRASTATGPGRPLVALALLVAALAWFGWLGSVRVRFERNLLPGIVLASIAVGHGWAAMLDGARSLDRRLSHLAAAACGLMLLGPAQVSETIVEKLRSKDTRSLAVEWIESHIAVGSSIVREEYTPQPDPTRFDVRYVWSLAAGEPSQYQRENVDYLVASQGIYGRIVNSPQPEMQPMARRYAEMFLYPRAARFSSGPGVHGPYIEILEVPHEAERR